MSIAQLKIWFKNIDYNIHPLNSSINMLNLVAQCLITEMQNALSAAPRRLELKGGMPRAGGECTRPFYQVLGHVRVYVRTVVGCEWAESV